MSHEENILAVRVKDRRPASPSWRWIGAAHETRLTEYIRRHNLEVLGKIGSYDATFDEGRLEMTYQGEKVNVTMVTRKSP